MTVLKMVLDGTPFNSSDSFSRKRSLYAVMFSEARGTKISCGRTKAQYIAVHAIAPFVREQMTLEMSNKLFALHVDEST